MERPAAPGPEGRARLAHFLIGKALAETLLVSTLAVGFYLTAFTPFFRGSLDAADARQIAGWAVNHNDPQARVEVQLYIDGRFVAHRAADAPRPDVLAAGRAADERHGFAFDTPQLPAGQHEARVYAVHASGEGRRRTLQLVDKPLTFTVAAGEARE
jgi:hypothetical protein